MGKYGLDTAKKQELQRSGQVLDQGNCVRSVLGACVRRVTCIAAASSLPSLLRYYERGVCYHALNKLSKALDDFTEAESRMKGSSVVSVLLSALIASVLPLKCRHYDELGLAFSLHLAEVQFNKGCVLIRQGRQSEGIATLQKTIFLKALHADRVIQGVHADSSRIIPLLRVVSLLSCSPDLALATWPLYFHIVI